MTPKVDIIVPVYNAKKYLAKCIRSIQKQTFSDWRLILVDDGSTDGSGKICDHFAVCDSRIIVVHQENRGLIGARKTGLANVTSEFISFVDADDLVEPEMFQKVLEAQIQYSADIVCCSYKTLSRKGWVKSGNREAHDRVEITSGKEESVRMASAMTSVSMWGKLYRRTVFEKAQDALETIPNIFFGEDTMINAAVFAEADIVVKISGKLYDYRTGGGSSGSTERTMVELMELYRWRKNYLLTANADIKYHKANLAQTLNVAVYYAHYSKKLLSREKICSDLAYVISDIEQMCPNYKHKNAYDLNIPMTDKAFKSIYQESPLIAIKKYLLRFF